MINVYKYQLKNGRHFLYEHPVGASSWDMQEAKDLRNQKGELTTTID